MQVISGHLGWVRSVAFSPNNEWFCTGSSDRTIKVVVLFNHEWFYTDLGYCIRLRLTLTGHIEQVRGTVLKLMYNFEFVFFCLVRFGQFCDFRPKVCFSAFGSKSFEILPLSSESLTPSVFFVNSGVFLFCLLT
ncbi:putative transcription factor WD40-like family [Helianthus anomalus]